MHLTLLFNDDTIPVDVPDMAVEDFAALVEAETGVGADHQVLVVDGKHLTSGLLSEHTVDHDIVVVRVRELAPEPDSQLATAATATPATATPASLVPPARLDSPDRQAIEASLLYAYENTPEAFTDVIMLYIPMRINSTPVTAFVDTGALKTLLSPRMAKKLGLAHLIDARYSGEARGVGTGRIVGRIHAAPVAIGGVHLSCAFQVLDTDMDVLLGLDMLRSYQAVVDLGKGCLNIGGVSVAFMSEGEVERGRLVDKADDGGVVGLALALGLTQGAVPARAAADAAERRQREAAGPAALGSSAAGASAAVPATTSSAASAPAPAAVFPEAAIASLMDLGFSRAQVLQALQAADGNSEMAALVLFGYQ